MRYLVTVTVVIASIYLIDAQAAISPSTSIAPSAWKYQANVFAENLKRDLAKSKSDGERYQSLQRTIANIRSLQENNVIHDAGDSAYMDLMVAGMEAVPKESGFSKKNCKRYEYNFLNEFEPTADDEPTEPAVKPGWDMLQALCR